MNLTEVILALTIILLMLASIANFMHIGTEKNVQKRVAEEAQEIARAADEYAQKYHARLMPNLTPTSGRSITIRDLVNDNFLKPGTAEENIWGQTYGIYFRRVDTTVPDGMGGTKDDHGIRVVVLTEGGVRGADDEIFVNKIVPGVIPFMSAGAGFTPSGVLPNQPRGSLVGTGWTMDLNSMGVPDPGPGHIGVVSTFNTPAIAHDFLYRKDIGIEELNTMETEMHMDDHAILASKEIRFIPHTLAEMDQFCTNNPEDSRLFQLEDNGLYLCRKGRVAAAPFAIQEVMDTGNVLQIKDIRQWGYRDQTRLCSQYEHLSRDHTYPSSHSLQNGQDSSYYGLPSLCH